jgi:HK97 gp10 family phage protein
MRLEIIGIKEADAILNELSKRMQITIIRQGMRKAVKPTIAQAKANAPKRSGKLKKSIGAVNARDKSGFPGIDVGARKKIAPHAHLIEYGVSGVVKKLKKKTKGGNRYKVGQRYRKDIGPNAFMRKAVDATIKQVEKTYGVEIGEALYRRIARHNKVK